MKLEHIVPGSRLTGILGETPVEVLATKAIGPDALQVVFRGPNGPGERVVYREDEEQISEVAPSRQFAFDGDPRLFRLALEALRIRLAHLFDPFIAVDASQIDPLPHQLTAVYDVMLHRQPLRFLLADDPGAGKTIMAGLLIKELLIRGALERCLIIAPGSLVEQWQDELLDKFDLKFEILTREKIEASTARNPFDEHPLLIARLDMLARNDDLKEKLEAAPTWDLVVCDEAHRMSASFFGQEVKYTKRYQLGALAGRKSHHFLLMTATPHNGKEEDFQLFMGLLDEDRFEGRFRQGVHKADPSDMMRRLTKEELYRFDEKPLFPERKSYTAAYDLSPKEAELYEEVTSYVRNEMNRADRLGKDGKKRRINVGFALQVLQRRLASSPAAIYESLKRRRARLEARLEEERLVRAGRDSKELISQPDQEPMLDEEWFEEEASGEEREAEEEKLVDQATAAQTLGELEAEIASLKLLENMAHSLRRSGEDAKWLQLREILDDPEVRDPKSKVRRKIVIFTEARDTLLYLAGRIRGLTGEAESVVEIHGSIPRDRRRGIIASFNDDPSVRFLLANDAAGEGVNLHRGAHLMVNYDLPWNPNRLEQRFGRIHRIGQTEVCHLWNLVATDTREGEVYKILLDKLETVRETLGGKVYDVLGELFESRSLRVLFMDAIRYGEQPEVRDRLFRTIEGSVDIKHIENIVRRNKLTREGLDPSTVRGVREKMERAAVQRIQPYHICSFFKEAFNEVGGTMRQREKERFELTRVPPSLRDRDRLIGRGDPVLTRYERICFDKDLIAGHPQAALVAPGHSLLDSLIDVTLEHHRSQLMRGAVLVDESNQYEKPRVMVVLKQSIRDGRTTRIDRPHIVSERLLYIWLDDKGHTVERSSAPNMQGRTLKESEKSDVAKLLGKTWLQQPLEDRASHVAVTELLPQHLKEVKELRLDELEHIESAVMERMRREKTHLYHRTLEVEAEEKAGKRPKLNSENFRRQTQLLNDRLESRLADIAKQRHITALPPVVCGAVIVIPKKLLSREVEDEEVDHHYSLDPVSRKDIEERAMQAVMDEERSFGRIPSDVSEQNLGYDIESYDPQTKSWLFLEVKGRKADAKAISLTRNEMLSAHNVKNAYILAVVLVDGDTTEKPMYLRNPSILLGSPPELSEHSRFIFVKAIRDATMNASAQSSGEVS